LVIYAILTEQNIAKLFAAAMVPGILAMLGYMVTIAIYVRLVPGQAPEVDDQSAQLTLSAVTAITPIVIIFLIVFGGIYGGFFTPTEGAGVGAATTFIAALLRREITWSKFKQCFYATAESSAMIFLIFIGADLMNAALALTQVPNQLASVVGSWGLSPLMVVTAILLFYVVLGAVMDELSMILLTIPIFFPMVMGLDFGMPKESVAIWFGIMVLMVVEFGLLAPPVGLNVYVVNGMAKDVPIAESYRGVMPFLISDTLRTLLLLFFPGICLWLVQYLS
jgi:tripartite ATP-independent transporter DctM subunit